MIGTRPGGGRRIFPTRREQDEVTVMRKQTLDPRSNREARREWSATSYGQASPLAPGSPFR
jgi:hypothetical protein